MFELFDMYSKSYLELYKPHLHSHVRPLPTTVLNNMSVQIKYGGSREQNIYSNYFIVLEWMLNKVIINILHF